MKNTIKLLEELRDIVKVDERNIAYVFNSLQRIITEAKGSLQQSHKSAEDWLKKHNYVDSGIEWNPLPSPNEGMRVSISSVLDQFVSSQQLEPKSAEDSMEITLSNSSLKGFVTKLKVESGWLYNFWDTDRDNFSKEWVFVPFAQSQQSNECVKPSDDLTEIIQDRIKKLHEFNDVAFKNYRDLS